MQEINYDKALKMVIKDTSSWKRRKITPIGKIVIIKSLIWAKINHMLSTLPNPTEVFIKKIDHLIFKLLWNDKPDKIKRAIVTQNYHEGGLKMPNFKNIILSSKAVWLRRLLRKENMIWSELFYAFIASKTDLFTNGLNWFVQLANSTSNPFWKDVLSCYAFIVKKYQ